tara:strand:- start:7793 stop:8017 length:225 start_codon:yes stop_codon:yes gene_type:complete
MFWLALVAMGIVLIGMTVLDSELSESLLFLTAYWGFCLILVILMLLLAAYDMLSVSQELRASDSKNLDNKNGDS